MRRLMLRIMGNAGLAALILGLLGLVYAELAGLMLARPHSAGPGNPFHHSQDGGTETLTVEEVRQRVPLRMALGGFAFVSLCEMGLFLWRRRFPPPPLAATPPEPDAEALLEELLAQVEAAEKAHEPPATPTRPAETLPELKNG